MPSTATRIRESRLDTVTRPVRPQVDPRYRPGIGARDHETDIPWPSSAVGGRGQRLDSAVRSPVWRDSEEPGRKGAVGMANACPNDLSRAGVNGLVSL